MFLILVFVSAWNQTLFTMKMEDSSVFTEMMTEESVPTWKGI